MEEESVVAQVIAAVPQGCLLIDAGVLGCPRSAHACIALLALLSSALYAAGSRGDRELTTIIS
jgi:hypothetical protein